MVLMVYSMGIALGMSLISLCISILVGIIVYSALVYAITKGRVIGDIMEVVAATK